LDKLDMFKGQGHRVLPHPDYILLLETHEVIIVEETGVPEPRDVVRMNDFLSLMRGRWGEVLSGIEPIGITVVVHFHARAHGGFVNSARYWARRLMREHGADLYLVACDRELRQRLRIAFGEGK